MTVGYTSEEAVIGSVVVDSSYSLSKVKGILNPEHFSDYTMSHIYELALTLDREGTPIDSVTMLSRLNSKFGPLLVSICEKFPGCTNVEAYRDDIIRKYHERRLKTHFESAIKSPNGDVIQKIEREWKGIQSLGAKKFDLTEKIMAYTDVLERRGKGDETFYPTGFPTLDYKVPLLKRGEMCVIGARTSMGKTSLLLSLMLRMAEAGLKVVFASGEMSFNQIMDRIIALKTSIPLLDIRKGNVQKSDWSKITNVLGEISGNMKIRFIEAASLSLDKIMPHVVEFKPDVLFVDYIQRFSSPGRVDSRAAFYSDVANNLKGLSVEKNIVVIAASQLGRGVEQRKDQPRLSDLKESGGLEESADVVWALHSEIGQKEFSKFMDYTMLILKNRNGPIFNFDAVFDPGIARFREKELTDQVA